MLPLFAPPNGHSLATLAFAIAIAIAPAAEAAPVAIGSRAFKLDTTLASLVLLDGVTTEMMLTRQAGGWHWQEKNPLPGMKHRAGRLAWGVAFVLAVSWAEGWLERHDHHTLAGVVRWVPRVVEFGLSAHNFRLAHR